MPSIGDIFISDNWSVSQTFAQHTYGWSGIDYAIPMRTPLLACWDGVIESVQSIPDGWGNNLRVRSLQDPSYIACYTHCDQLLKNNGDTVRCGELIAYSGSSGTSTGPHLHFTILHPDGHPIDPNSMTWDIKNLTEPIGGEDMVTRQILEALFVVYLERNPDQGAYTTYVGKPVWDVIWAIANSPERADLLAKKAKVLSDLQTTVTDLQTKADGQGKIIDEQEQTISEMASKVALLEKCDCGASQGLTHIDKWVINEGDGWLIVLIKKFINYLFS